MRILHLTNNYPTVEMNETLWEKKTHGNIHSPETNSSHLKIDGWNTTFLLGRPIFRCLVSFKEGIINFCHPFVDPCCGCLIEGKTTPKQMRTAFSVFGTVSFTKSNMDTQKG